MALPWHDLMVGSVRLARQVSPEMMVPTNGLLTFWTWLCWSILVWLDGLPHICMIYVYSWELLSWMFCLFCLKQLRNPQQKTDNINNNDINCNHTITMCLKILLYPTGIQPTVQQANQPGQPKPSPASTTKQPSYLLCLMILREHPHF